MVNALALEDAPQGSRHRETVRRLRMEPGKGSEEDQVLEKCYERGQGQSVKEELGRGHGIAAQCLRMVSAFKVLNTGWGKIGLLY